MNLLKNIETCLTVFTQFVPAIRKKGENVQLTCGNVSYAALKANATHTYTGFMIGMCKLAGFVSMIDFSTGRTTHSLPRVSMDRDVTNTILFFPSFSAFL